MAVIYPEAGENSAENLVQEAQATFRRAARALNTLIDELEGSNHDNSAEASRLVRELKSALTPALSERERLEQAIRKDAGAVNAYALDFDAARHEVGRRLARLRAAAGEGEISG